MPQPAWASPSAPPGAEPFDVRGPCAPLGWSSIILVGAARFELTTPGSGDASCGPRQHRVQRVLAEWSRLEVPRVRPRGRDRRGSRHGSSGRTACSASCPPWAHRFRRGNRNRAGRRDRKALDLACTRPWQSGVARGGRSRRTRGGRRTRNVPPPGLASPLHRRTRSEWCAATSSRAVPANTPDPPLLGDCKLVDVAVDEGDVPRVARIAGFRCVGPEKSAGVAGENVRVYRRGPPSSGPRCSPARRDSGSLQPVPSMEQNAVASLQVHYLRGRHRLLPRQSGRGVVNRSQARGN